MQIADLVKNWAARCSLKSISARLIEDSFPENSWNESFKETSWLVSDDVFTKNIFESDRILSVEFLDAVFWLMAFFLPWVIVMITIDGHHFQWSWFLIGASFCLASLFETGVECVIDMLFARCGYEQLSCVKLCCSRCPFFSAAWKHTTLALRDWRTFLAMLQFDLCVETARAKGL